MEQSIQAPDDTDIDRIARMLILSDQIASDVTGGRFDGSLADLDRLQRILDSGQLTATRTVELQALGLRLGKIFIETQPGYDWWMVEDAYGRDPCIRYRTTSLKVFPMTMISKRIEGGETVDIRDMFLGLKETLARLRREHYANE